MFEQTVLEVRPTAKQKVLKAVV